MSVLQTRLITGVKKRPIFATLYGKNGVGKTTFAASAPGAVIIDTEKGADIVGSDRFQPETYEECLDILDALATEDHAFQTVAIDTIDGLERLIQAHIIQANSWTPADYDSYGRGAKLSVQELRPFFAALERLMDRGLNILLLAHSQLRREKAATSAEEVDVLDLRTAPAFAAMFRDVPDIVAMMERERTVDTIERRKVATLTGRVILRTRESATHHGKSRYDLPETIEIPHEEGFSALKAAVDTASHVPSSEELEEAFNKLPNERQEKARAWYSSQRDKTQAARKVLKEAVNA